MSKYFNLYSKYYNLLYKERDYQKEAKYLFDKFKKYLPELKNILEIGIGTGNHAKILQDQGLKITGIEISEQMAAQAEKKGIQCYISDCSEFKLNKKFDGAMAVFHVISYITENDKLLRTFRNIYNHLKSDGIFIFDVWYAPAVYNLKPEKRIKEIESEELKVTRYANPEHDLNNNVVTVKYDLVINDKENGNDLNISEIHPMRYFSLPELKLIASCTGFDVLEAEEWMTGKLPSENTWGICLTLKRRKYE